MKRKIRIDNQQILERAKRQEGEFKNLPSCICKLLRIGDDVIVDDVPFKNESYKNRIRILEEKGLVRVQGKVITKVITKACCPYCRNTNEFNGDMDELEVSCEFCPENFIVESI